MPYVKLPTGERLSYVATAPIDVGSQIKPILLCIHGAPGDSTLFRKQFEDQVLTSHFTLLAFDLPGFGASSHLPPPKTLHQVPNLATTLYNAVSAIVPPNVPVHLLGHGIGSLIIKYILVQYSERFQSAVLMSPIALRKDDYIRVEFHDLLVYLFSPDDDEDGALSPLRESTQHVPTSRISTAMSYAFLGDNHSDQILSLLVDLCDVQLYQDADGGMEARRSFFRQSVTEDAPVSVSDLATVRTPMLIIRGTEDVSQPLASAKEHLACLFNSPAELIEIEGGAHWVPFTTSGAASINPLIAQFLLSGHADGSA